MGFFGIFFAIGRSGFFGIFFAIGRTGFFGIFFSIGRTGITGALVETFDVLLIWKRLLLPVVVGGCLLVDEQCEQHTWLEMLCFAADPTRIRHKLHFVFRLNFVQFCDRSEPPNHDCCEELI